jgi:hypothetical protein
MPRELSPADLADLLRTTERASAKPAPPVSMSAVIARGVVAGVGAVLLLGSGLYWMQAPLDTLATAPAVAGVLVTGVVLLASAFPTEKIAPALLTVRRLQHVQATVNAAEFRKRKAYEAVETIEANTTARIAELERALAEAIQDSRNARMELRRTQETLATAGARRTFVPKSNTEPQVVRDAQNIIRHWFEAGAWYSRPKALQAGWTEDRHSAAVRLLDDAALVGKAGKLREVQAASLDAALKQLADWRESAEFAPVLPTSSPVYVESE